MERQPRTMERRPNRTSNEPRVPATDIRIRTHDPWACFDPTKFTRVTEAELVVVLLLAAVAVAGRAGGACDRGAASVVVG